MVRDLPSGSLNGLPRTDFGRLVMENAFPRNSPHLKQKPVRVLLRGGDSLDGNIHLPEGVPLLNFLGNKRYFLNLTSVRPTDAPGEEEALEHLSLRVSNVVWVVPLDSSLHVSAALAPTNSSRAVELRLVDGLTLAVKLNISEEQRMSDFLDANSGFVPLLSAQVQSAQVQSGSEVIPRLAVNHEAILAIRELPTDQGT